MDTASRVSYHTDSFSDWLLFIWLVSIAEQFYLFQFSTANYYTKLSVAYSTYLSNFRLRYIKLESMFFIFRLFTLNG